VHDLVRAPRLVSSASFVGLLPADPQAASSPGPPVHVHEINERRVKKSTIFYTTTRKKDAVREDFGHLPPEQRKKALHRKLVDLEEEQRKDQKVGVTRSDVVYLLDCYRTFIHPLNA
jgi:hypothetical protein